MGTVYRALCPNCMYEKEFELGSGFNSMNLKRSAGMLDKNEQEVIQNLETQKLIKHFQIENHLTECTFCQDIIAKMIITITDRQEFEHQFGTSCKKCCHKRKVYPNTIPYNVLCPKCRKQNLNFEEIGYWD